MTDNLNAKASLDFDLSQAIQSVNSLTTRLAVLGEVASGQTAKDLSRLERQSVNLARGMSSLSGQTNIASVSARNNLSFIKQQERAYASYAPNIRVSSQAQRDFKTANDSSTRGLISQRYALYDVAQTWGMISVAILGAAAASATFAIDYQSNFAQVQRTTGVTGTAIGELKTALIDLTTAIPTSFSEVTDIAALGGQLGVASTGIENFTTVVAQMTATTDLSAESAGTALGRFQALLGVPSSEFENLGSSILKVGINSVATESQIVSVATQLASMGKFAGMTADQVIGMAGALASVGAPAERSRGAITRLFTLISQAVGSGGEELQQFADIAGVSSGEFAAAWGTDKFASVFQSFLQGVRNSADASAALRELGITSTRDVPLLMSLANASDVVTGSFADAASGYSDATELGSQYAIIAETIASKLTVLGNTLKAAIVAVGDGGLGPLSNLLALVQNLAEAFLTIARNPVGKFFIGVAASIGVLVGVMAAYRAMQALTLASMYAMKTAQDSLSASAVRSATTLRGLTGTVVSMGVGMQRATAFTTAYNGSLNVGIGRAAAFRNGLTAVKAEAVGAGLALKSALVTAGIGAAIMGITWAVEQLSNSLKTSNERASEYFDGVSSFSEAIRSDTDAYNTAADQAKSLGETFDSAAAGFTTYAVKTEEVTTSLNPFGEALAGVTGAQITLNENTTETTNTIVEQTVAVGEATRTMLATTLANSTKFQETWAANGDAVTAAGFSLQTLLDKIVSGPQGGTDYLNGFIAQYQEMILLQQQSNDLNILSGAGGDVEAQGRATLASLQDTAAGFDALREAVAGSDYEISNAIASNDIYNGLIGNLDSGLEDTADSVDTLSSGLQDLLDTESQLTDNTAGVQGALSGLGESLATNGNSFSAYSEAGRSNLSALQQTLSAMVTASDGDSTRLATMIAGLMQQLASYGVDTVNQLAFVQSYLAQLTGGKGTSGLTGVGLAAQEAGLGLGQGFATGAGKAAKAAKSAAKTVRTLTDYVKDLAGVFSAAFDIRFGLDQSIDKVADAYQSLIDYSDDAAQAVKDAAQSIAEADAKIRGLNAAGITLEYQLRVAQEYGDVLRANEILAEMADNNAKLTSEQNDRTKSEKELKDAQDASAKSLDGGTEASREQREQVLSLLSAYQDQLSALANTGLSQTQLAARTAVLKQQFMDQLRQLGYNESAIQRYAQSFDDLSYAILHVPRNITISADTNAAIRAVDEYTAHLRTAQGVSNALGNSVISPRVDDSALQKMARGAAIYAKIIQYQNAYSQTGSEAAKANLAYYTALLASGNYRTGGQVPNYLAAGGVPGIHPGQPKGTDTIPAWLTPDEYVVQRQASQYYGLPFMNALNNMQLPKYLASGGPAVARSGPVGGIGLVELLPTQLQQIVDALSIRLEIDGKEMATVVNKVNASSTKRGTN